MSAAGVQRMPEQSEFSVFKPDKEPLVIRGTIGNVFDESQKQSGRISKMRNRKPLLQDVPPLAERPLESHLNLPSPRGLAQGSPRRSRPGSKSSSRFGAYSQASFFSRHNPHPFRVRHIEGLNGQPICAVHDHDVIPSARFSIRTPSTREREKIFQSHIPPAALGLSSTTFPINIITGLQHYPFREKAVPRIGLIPITDSWRDELRGLCEKAGLLPDEPVEQPPPPPVQRSILPETRRKTVYSSETGRIVPPPSRAMSRQASRQRGYPVGYQHISAYPDTETVMLELLCQILQTDSVQEVQQWLVSAGDREKALVLDMIKSAMGNEEEVLRQQEAEKQQALAATKAVRPSSVQPTSRPNTAAAMGSNRPATGTGVRTGDEHVIMNASARKTHSARPLGTPSRAASRRVLDEVKAGASPTMRYTTTPNVPLGSRGRPSLPAIQETVDESSAVPAS